MAAMSPLELQQSSFSLTDELHRFGINCRHLGTPPWPCALTPKGRVRQALPPSANNFKQSFVLTEIVARACKNELRRLWRETLEEKKVPSSEPYLAVVVAYFNRLLHNEHSCWCDVAQIKTHIEAAFDGALTRDELGATYDLRRSVDVAAVLLRLQKIAKVKLTKRINLLIRFALFLPRATKILGRPLTTGPSRYLRWT